MGLKTGLKTVTLGHFKCEVESVHFVIWLLLSAIEPTLIMFTLVEFSPALVELLSRLFLKHREHSSGPKAVPKGILPRTLRNLSGTQELLPI